MNEYRKQMYAGHKLVKRRTIKYHKTCKEITCVRQSVHHTHTLTKEIVSVLFNFKR